MFSANAVKPSSPTSLATAISLFFKSRFACVSGVCISDRRLPSPPRGANGRCDYNGYRPDIWKADLKNKGRIVTVIF